MNRPFAEQRIAPVYAVNTLHVAYDLGVTLEEIRRALRPGGALIVSECVHAYPGYAVYTEFVFHLIETFRAPRLDEAHRPNGGFLTPEQWKGALEAAGFADPRFVPTSSGSTASCPTSSPPRSGPPVPRSPPGWWSGWPRTSGRVGGGAGLTSPASRRLRLRSSERCDGWGGPRWGLKRGA